MSKYDKFLGLWMTADERQLVEMASAIEGKSLSEIIRRGGVDEARRIIDDSQDHDD